MKIEQYHIGFIGFGHMAKTLWHRLEHLKWIEKSQVLFIQRDKSKQKENSAKYHLSSTSLEKLVERSDVLFLCIRPQDLEVIAHDVAKEKLKGKLVISILAGTKIETLRKSLGEGAIIARAMPNVCSSLGEGMTLLCWEKGLSEEHQEFIRLVFSAVGKVQKIREDLMDLSTAIAGSGPAFVYKLIDMFSQIAIEGGLSKEEAIQMVAQTFIGAGKMIQKEPFPQKLIDQVAIPGGMTAAGLSAMENGKIETTLQQVISSAVQRAEELGRGN